jgi:hypothetical protein
VIYLKNGNILLVDKAWEEGETVKYETSKGVQSLPKSSVEKIRQEKPVTSPAGRQWARVAPDDAGDQTGSRQPASARSTLDTPPGTAISKEAVSQLRSNLKADPSDAMARAELAHALYLSQTAA